MPSVSDEIVKMEAAYRRARFIILGHVLFLGVTCSIAYVMRRALGLSPLVLATVLIVALIVFGGDIMKLLYCRNELRRLRGLHDSR